MKLTDEYTNKHTDRVGKINKQIDKRKKQTNRETNYQTDEWSIKQIDKRKK